MLVKKWAAKQSQATEDGWSKANLRAVKESLHYGILHNLADLLEAARDDAGSGQSADIIEKHLDCEPICDASGKPKQACRKNPLCQT